MDFSLATRLKKGKSLKEGIGVPYYLSPEMIKGNYDFRTDIWSLGVLIFILLWGFPPFQGSNPQSILKDIKSKKTNIFQDKNLSPEAQDLLQGML